VKPLVMALLLLGVAVHSAQAQVPPPQPIGQAPCGIPMFVFQTGFGAMSTIYRGAPIILIDPDIQNGDPKFLAFTVYHECGHHMLGHLLPEGLAVGRFMRPQQELAADCYAARQASLDVSRAAADSLAQTQGNNSPAPGYPTGNERAVNIRQCAGGIVIGPTAAILKRIIDGASSDFQSVRGKSLGKISGEGIWEATVALPGRPSCTVSAGDNDDPPRVECIAFAGSTDSVAAKVAYQDLIANLKSVLTNSCAVSQDDSSGKKTSIACRNVEADVTWHTNSHNGKESVDLEIDSVHTNAGQ
jgi:hypothetical protein